MKTLILSLFIFMYTTSLFALDLKLEREQLQQQYLNFHSYPILIVDQDELNWRYLQAGLVDDQDREESSQRAQIFGDYIQERTGVQLSPQQLNGVEVYTSTLKDGAFAVPVVKRLGINRQEYQLCMVFSASENTNQQLEHERLLGLHDEAVYGDLSYNRLKYKLPYSTLALFSLYHELAHCLDQTFMPRMYESYIDAHTVHLAENFAEGLATLMLHKRGIKDVSRIRSFHRLLYSRMMGRQFAQNPQLGFGDPMFTRAGVIYHLEPSLRGAEIFLTVNRNRLPQLETIDLIEEMNIIVDSYALNSRSFHAIGLYLEATHPMQVIEDFRLKAFEDPHWFYEPYQLLLQYHDYSTYVLSSMFHENDLQNDPPEDLDTLSFKEFCQAYQSQNYDEYYLLLEFERAKLKASKGPTLSLRQRAQELNQLETTLYLNCKADLAQF
jgi:hypothetical protein